MTTPRKRMMRIWQGIVFRPTSTAWVVAFLLGILVAEHRLQFIPGMLIWMALGFGLLMAATHREAVIIRKSTQTMMGEVATVHGLVNSQHDELVDRIAQLVLTLERAGVAVPEGGKTVDPPPPAPRRSGRFPARRSSRGEA